MNDVKLVKDWDAFGLLVLITVILVSACLGYIEAGLVFVVVAAGIRLITLLIEEAFFH